MYKVLDKDTIGTHQRLDAQLSFPTQQIRYHNGKLERIQLSVLHGLGPEENQKEKV